MLLGVMTTVKGCIYLKFHANKMCLFDYLIIISNSYTISCYKWNFVGKNETNKFETNENRLKSEILFRNSVFFSYRVAWIRRNSEMKCLSVAIGPRQLSQLFVTFKCFAVTKHDSRRTRVWQLQNDSVSILTQLHGKQINVNLIDPNAMYTHCGYLLLSPNSNFVIKHFRQLINWTMAHRRGE